MSISAELAEAVISCLMLRQPNLALVVGRAGVGKANLLHAVAHRLIELNIPLDLWVVDMGLVMSGTLFDGEREKLLASLPREASASQNIALALEHVEQSVSGVPRGPLLLARALDCGARLIGTSAPANLGQCRRPPLTRRLRLVELPEM